MAGQQFVISAPSGAGKSTIINALKERVDGLGYCISHTSRRPRGTERDGMEYHFVERETFSKMIREGAFVEWARVYEDFYGTSFSSLKEQISLGLDVLLDVDAQGAKNIRRHFEDSVLLYILPPSLEILERRLRDRSTDDESIIDARVAKAQSDMKNCLWYDYVIINDDLEKAVEKAQSIVVAERCRTRRNWGHILKIKH